VKAREGPRSSLTVRLTVYYDIGIRFPKPSAVAGVPLNCAPVAMPEAPPNRACSGTLKLSVLPRLSLSRSGGEGISGALLPPWVGGVPSESVGGMAGGAVTWIC